MDKAREGCAIHITAGQLALQSNVILKAVPTYLRQLIKAAEEFVEDSNQLLCCALRSESREAHYVSKENPETRNMTPLY